MDKNKLLQFEQWARFAQEDLTVAGIILNGHFIEKVHQLPYILEICMKIDPSFEELKEDAFYLTRFYIETRYPGDNAQFSFDEAQKALAAAVKIKKFISEKITD